ncbi:hypothetical protein NDA07_20800 [Microcoleus vaginatus DQ-U2]|uniref:hypothetical protein n=1 Tax=Microcoleus vaginatus TaxID=119532 RepID=UPI0016878FC7|nr:hypothetical protein [Microcoleus sp. FACHB-DQ6]
MIGWLHDRHSVMYAAILAWIVCGTLYRTGFYPNSIAGSKVGLLAKTFYWRAIGATNGSSRKPKLNGTEKVSIT